MDTAVVSTKNTTASPPARLSCSTSSLATSPRMMEANTSGTTIICMRLKKSWPGSAAQLEMVAADSRETHPTVGPRARPAAMPRTMPMTTLTHRRPATRD